MQCCVKYVAVVSVCITVCLANTHINDICTTPNKEVARCMLVTSCPIIQDSVRNGDRFAKEFARESSAICGFGEDHVTAAVCCGTHGTYVDLELPTTTTPKYIIPAEEVFPVFAPNRVNGGNHIAPQQNAFRDEDHTFRVQTFFHFAAVESPAIQSYDEPQPNPQYSYVQNTSPKPSSQTPTPKPLKTACGRPTVKNNHHFQGEDTSPGDYPWLVLLKFINKTGGDAGYQCVGTLINQEYVLTAAHCVAGNITRLYSLKDMRLGEHDLAKDPDCFTGREGQQICADGPLDVEIGRVIPHPAYNSHTGVNDIALIKLKYPLVYTDYIRAICLPSKFYDYPRLEDQFVYSGWDKIKDEEGFGSSITKAANVTVASPENCSRIFKHFGLMQLTSLGHVCTEAIRGAEVCKGYSGGPIMSVFNGEWYQEGVVTFTSTCGRSRPHPGHYLRISQYLSWIKNEMQK